MHGAGHFSETLCSALTGSSALADQMRTVCWVFLLRVLRRTREQGCRGRDEGRAGLSTEMMGPEVELNFSWGFWDLDNSW